MGFWTQAFSKQADAKDNQTPRARLVALFSVLYVMASDLTKCTHLKMHISRQEIRLAQVYSKPTPSSLTLVIYRPSQEDSNSREIPLSLLQVEERAGPPPNVVESRDVYGIIGFIKLQCNEYVIVITDREVVGNIKNAKVCRIKSVSIESITQQNMTRQQQKTEQLFLQRIKDHFESNNLYYSYDYDITQSLQRQVNVPTGPRWKKADDRFFWNRYLASKMINTANQPANQHINEFILPIIQGFVSINTAHIRGQSFAFALISRRNCYRAGTRYFSRGIDKDGNVSNFVETEQLILYDEHTAGGYQFVGQHQLSFVQTRGSIPLFWAQVINMRYTPRLWMDDGSNSLTAMKSHFKDQTNIYGPQIIVNLVNKKGYEYPLAHAYADGIKDINDPNLTYIHFDFHHECRKMRWDRIYLLIDQIEEQLSQQGYCHYNAANTQAPYIQKSQTSVVRSNCMDCLDRTNVVQSTIAKWVLTKQLQELGILSSSEKIDEHERFMHLYRQVWSDNADVISLGYSGTGALKTDYTRTGQRTKMGAFEDLTKSLARYFKNNYMDGGRQDGFDLVLGAYEVPTSSRGDNPFEIEKPLVIRLMPLILLLSLTMCIYGVMLLGYSGITYTTLLCLFIAFWFSALVTAVHFMLQNSQYFVDWPRLVPLPGYIDSTVLDAPAKAGKNGFLPSKLANQLQRRGSKELSELEQGDKIPLKKIA